MRACVCDAFQALGREVKCIVQNGKKKSDVSERSSEWDKGAK